MLLTAIDPDLLIYDEHDWQTRQEHFFQRVNALSLHRSLNREYGQRIAMSDELVAIVYQAFPWSHTYRGVAELRDLRQFILEELGRVYTISSPAVADSVTLRPEDLTCGRSSVPGVRESWRTLLRTCIGLEDTSEVGLQVATWPLVVQEAECEELFVSIVCQSKNVDYRLPLVWDTASWHSRLGFQDFWPDLHKCVDSYAQSNFARYESRRTRVALSFDCTDKFSRSVVRLCQPPIRHLLIKALAKKVHGIHDVRLHDEALGELRRFRVTRFWRVHYRDLGERILLHEFGPHDMGL